MRRNIYRENKFCRKEQFCSQDKYWNKFFHIILQRFIKKFPPTLPQTAMNISRHMHTCAHTHWGDFVQTLDLRVTLKPLLQCADLYSWNQEKIKGKGLQFIKSVWARQRFTHFKFCNRDFFLCNHSFYTAPLEQGLGANSGCTSIAYSSRPCQRPFQILNLFQNEDVVDSILF